MTTVLTALDFGDHNRILQRVSLSEALVPCRDCGRAERAQIEWRLGAAEAIVFPRAGHCVVRGNFVSAHLATLRCLFQFLLRRLFGFATGRATSALLGNRLR